MPETDHGWHVRQYEALANELDMTDDTCFVCMESECHSSDRTARHDHNCACLDCIRSGAALAEGD
jgi:hypothetical protein